jgi:hypothetical protein
MVVMVVVVVVVVVMTKPCFVCSAPGFDRDVGELVGCNRRSFSLSLPSFISPLDCNNDGFMDCN